MARPPDSPSDFTLDSKYEVEEGSIVLSGIQALVRLPLDQHRADRARGLRTATLVSGYRGSPLGGLDVELQRSRTRLDEHEVRFLPGVNEDLGATAVFGSQLTGLFPRAKYDGVLGMWYGKAPGVDRTGDVFKHANFAGVSRNGGVLAVAGDDATAKSSTLPSSSEAAFFDALMPVLVPGNVEEVVALGRAGFELSRYSGLWVGLKIATEVADAFETARVSPRTIEVLDPGFTWNGRPWRATQSLFLAAPVSLELEREIHEGRLEAARSFARANGLNRVAVSTPDDRIGIAAPGRTYYDLREALASLGLDGDGLRRYGIRLLKVGQPFPLDRETATEFGRGLQEILVIEEKRSFLELFLKEALYDVPHRPRIVGKRDERGDVLVRADGALDADAVVEVLARRLRGLVPEERLSRRLGVLGYLRETAEEPLPTQRLFHYCSGCPHSRSTLVPEGSIAGAGIGCHSMAMMMDRGILGITHMGGEGVQWVGMAPFTETPHLFQNLGDGTLFHSGTLAIRQAVASSANLTYKILYNGAVAMTGGQPADGAMSIAALTRALEAEGVRRTIVVTNDVRSFDRSGLAPGVDVWPRGRLDEAQRALRETPGVTVLVYDQHCAADLRRKRRRGEAKEPSERIFINEAVCEGCGDCGVKSSCLSLYPVDTRYGRKTQVHQASCNKDYSCIDGDCPSFVEVLPGTRSSSSNRASIEEGPRLPPPEARRREARLYLVGIGGTGVVTASRLLATAAALEGKRVRCLDQTGLSQKGGPVVSHVKILEDREDLAVSNAVAGGEADAYLAFDVLAAAATHHLSRARSDRTVAVVSTSLVPTGRMVTHVGEIFPPLEELTRRIDAHTRFQDNAYLDAVALAEHFFSSHMPANLIVLGAAYQKGLVPLEKWSVERAIELNGVDVETNRTAFYVGRRTMAEPEWVGGLRIRRTGSLEDERDQAPVLPDGLRTAVDGLGGPETLRRLVAERAAELCAYQNEAYARRYVDAVAKVRAREHEHQAKKETRLSEAVARYLFKLMAYKDEYEVARLHTSPAFEAELRRSFGEDARFRFLLHPPLLRTLGLKRKLELGAWFRPFLRALSGMRFLRGTALDPFGHTAMRRIERALPAEYLDAVDRALATPSPDTYDRAVAVAELPDVIRGYDDVKLRGVEAFRRALAEGGAMV